MKNIKKIDIHAHIGIRDTDVFPTCERLLECYELLNIEKGVLLPLATANGRYPDLTSECYYKASQTYPERLFYFCDVDQKYASADCDADFLNILQYHQSRGAKGLGELAFQLYADDPKLDKLFSACEEVGFPVTIHLATKFGNTYGIVDELGLPRLERVLQKHPKLIVLGHSQPFWAEISSDITEETRNDYPEGKVTKGRIWELMSKYENLYCDLSAGSGMNALMRDPENAAEFLHCFSDRVLFGCDMVAASCQWHLNFDAFLDDLVESGRLTVEDYRKFVRENAIRLLKL